MITAPPGCVLFITPHPLRTSFSNCVTEEGFGWRLKGKGDYNKVSCFRRGLNVLQPAAMYILPLVSNSGGIIEVDFLLKTYTTQ